MPSDIQDFINTFMGLKQVQNQTAQIAETQRQNTMQGVNIFLQMARQTAHPGELAALADRFAELGVGSRDQLTSLLTNVTPTEEALRSAETQFGLKIAGGDQSGTAAERSLAQDTASSALTGQSRAQRAVGDRQREALAATPSNTPFGEYLSKAFASQTLAGTTPGKATIDAIMLGLPTPELQQAAGVAIGTRPSAGENIGLQTAQANNRLGWAQLADESAWHAAQIGMDQMKFKLMAKKAEAGGLDPQDYVALITAKTQLVKAAQDAKNKNPSDVELQSIVGGLNAVNARMKAAGLPYEPPIENSADVLKAPFQRMLDSWWNNMRTK